MSSDTPRDPGASGLDKHSAVPHARLVLATRTGRGTRRAMIAAVAVGSLAVLVACGSGGVAPAPSGAKTGSNPPPAASPDGTPCPLSSHGSPTSTIDYVDFLQWGGRQYLAAAAGDHVTTVPVTAAARALGHTRCMLSALSLDPGYHPVDGDTGFVPAGTTVYEVKGYATQFRVAVPSGQRLAVYEVDTDPTARTGADVLDIGGKVRRVVLLDGDNADHVVRVIGAPGLVDRLVKDVLAAPVLPWTAANEAPLFVRFELADGTAVQRAWFPHEAVLERSIHLPPEVGRMLASGSTSL